MPRGAQGAVPGDHQPGVPERAGRGVPRGAKHNLQPGLTEDKGSPVPDCEEDPVLDGAVSDLPEGAQEGVLPHLTAQVPLGAKGDVLQGADPQLQAGSHKKVQPGAQNQMCLWKIDRSQLDEAKNVYHKYNQAINKLVLLLAQFDILNWDILPTPNIAAV